MDKVTNDSYESLMQFLYQAPVALVQTNLQGDIEIMNPMGSQLLMPLSPDGNLENLFDVLRQVAPQLRELAQSFRPANDSLDQSVGDAVLNLIAQRLQATLRLADSLGSSGGREQTAAQLGGTLCCAIPALPTFPRAQLVQPGFVASVRDALQTCNMASR